MTTGRINQVTTNSNDPSRVLPRPASAPRRPRKERGQNRGQSFRTVMNKETDNHLRIPSAFPLCILAHRFPIRIFPFPSAYFASSWLAIRRSARVSLSQAYLRPSSPLAFRCSRYSLHGSPSAFYKKTVLAS
jgi:hypothetical protein